MESFIQITRGFNKSDTVYTNVSLKNVEKYLKEHIDCYERTSQINRVYIDIDGKADINMSQDEFAVKDKNIENILFNLDFGSPHSLMKASKYELVLCRGLSTVLI